MGDIEFVIVLLGAAAVLVRLAESISVPYPIVLVVGGLADAAGPRARARRRLPRVPAAAAARRRVGVLAA